MWHASPAFLQTGITGSFAFGYPKSKLSLMGFTDSNYGDQKDKEYRATAGYCFFLSGILISYRAKREDTTATSTFEAEMQAAYMGIEEGLWLKHVLEEVEIVDKAPVPLFCDNNTLRLAKTSFPYTRHPGRVRSR